MIQLRILGSIDLRDSDGRELRAVLVQPKRLALLAYLGAIAPAFVQRDSLLALFWPELSDTRARAALNQAVNFLRKELGDRLTIVSRGEELGLDSAAIWCDASAFRQCAEGGRLAEALDVYRGNLLDGFFAGGADGFEEWLETERERLRTVAARTARALAEEQERNGRFADAVTSAGRAVELSALDERAVRELLLLLDRLGDRAGALAAYESFRRRLSDTLEAEPSAETAAVVELIRARDVAAPVALSDARPAFVADLQRRAPVAPKRSSRARITVFAAAGIPLLSIGAWLSFNRPAHADTRLLIAPFENRTGDARFNHIGLIAADRLTFLVSQRGSIEAVPTDLVLQAPTDASVPASKRLAQLADATHANLIVSGSVTLRGDSLAFQAQVTDAHTGKMHIPLDPTIGSASDPAAAVDALADRLLGGLGIRTLVVFSGFRPPKFDAYQAFAEGFDRFARLGKGRESRAFFERAIALDSSFTQAYFLLALQYRGGGPRESPRAESLYNVIERLPHGLTATERLTLSYARAAMRGDNEGMLRAQQALVARDSSPLALLLVGQAANRLLRPAIAVPALERSHAAYQLLGGNAAETHALKLADAYHQAGSHDREVKLLAEKGRANLEEFRAARLRALAAGGKRNAALALLDSIARDADPDSGTDVFRFLEASNEFRGHGDSSTAARVVTMGRSWIRSHPRRNPSGRRRHWEGVIFLLTGAPDSAAARFGVLARDTLSINDAGFLALTRLAMGDSAEARKAADSLGALRRPGLRGLHTFWQAAIFGALGEKAKAVALLRLAKDQGWPMGLWHQDEMLVPLHGFPAFEELIRPQR